MADKQTSGLTAAAALDGTELVHLVQSGNSRKDTAAHIALSASATAAQVRAGTASKNVTADVLQSAMAVQTLTDGATVAWDMSTAINAKVTIAGNRTLTVSNPVLGATYCLGVIQDATGSRTMTWPASFDWGTTGAPTLTATASKRDRITVFCTDASTPKFDAFLSGKGFS
jgi:putative exporter of polyketide antibiotics